MRTITRRSFLSVTGASVLSGSLPTASGETGGTGFIHDEAYLGKIKPPGHPESAERLGAVMREMVRTGLIDRVTRLSPVVEVESHIRRIHTTRHVEAIKKIPVVGHVAQLAAGGVIAAVDAVVQKRVRNAFCAIRPPGHHARNTGREEGFCCYNNVAIAAKHLQQTYGLEKVLIIDWDYHHGNGTEEAFYEDPTVLFFSTHNMRAYPGTGAPSRKGSGRGRGFNINIHLRCGATDNDVYQAWEEHLFPAAERFKPDFLLISAGFDSRKGDPLGCFEVTDIGFLTLTKKAMKIASDHCAGRLVSVLEGGYDPDGLGLAAAAHVTGLLGGA